MKRFNLAASLRGKVALGFLALAMINGIFAITAYFDLHFLQQRVVEGVVTGDFEFSIQEMRRHEKNLFLYGDMAALTEAMDMVNVALTKLSTQREAFLKISSPGQISELEASLKSYRDDLNVYELRPEQRHKLVAQIREKGHKVLGLVNIINQAEYVLQSQAIKRSQWVLGVSMLMLVISSVVVANLLMKTVITPLRLMKQDMDAIAKGQFNKLEPHSNDKELIVFSNAFNHMLHEIESRRRRLQHSEKMASLGVLTAGVAHELNNPLSNISSTCQLMIEDIKDVSHEQLTEWAQMIDSETKRATNIVKALLGFGRHQELQVQSIDVDALLQKTLVLLKGNIRQTKANITVDVPANLKLNADFQKLQQVIINVVRNALDTNKEKININISARLLPRKTDFDDGVLVAGFLDNFAKKASPVIHLNIVDDGPGIPEDVYPHIFDPFYTTHEPGMGMGLGLAIVEEIVEEHEGVISVISKQNQGTQVLIQLPPGNVHV